MQVGCKLPEDNKEHIFLALSFHAHPISVFAFVVFKWTILSASVTNQDCSPLLINVKVGSKRAALSFLL